MFLYVGTGMCMMAHGVGGRVHNRTQSLPTLTSLPRCLALRSSSKCWNYSWLPHLTGFHPGSGAPNSDLNTGSASVVSTEPSLQPLQSIFYISLY